MSTLASGTGALAAGVGLAVVFGIMVFGPTAQKYLSTPAEAGKLAAEHRPAAGQVYAWHDGRPVPRWLCYYWDLPAREITGQVLVEAKPDDLILVYLDRRPKMVAQLRAAGRAGGALRAVPGR